jgi:hypothetical protein
VQAMDASYSHAKKRHSQEKPKEIPKKIIHEKTSQRLHHALRIANLLILTVIKKSLKKR